MAKVAVVGAGIIGLSTALEIQKQTSCKVTIISEKFTPETTADGAAGIFGLYLLGSTQPDRQVKWAKRTHDLIETWWKSQNSGAMGISLISCRRMNHTPVPPIWKDVVFGVRKMTKEELKDVGRQLTGEHKSGLEMITFTAEPYRFMPYLMRFFEKQGGEILKQKVESLQELLKEYDCVVNCTGVHASYLTGDKLIKPLRGQVMRVSAPWIRTVILDDLDDGNYVIANQESVVVGGTHQDNDWDTIPREEDKQFIRDGGKCLDPSLDEAKEIAHWVGLRPGRPEVRLEREGCIVHNYGHGGSGITVFQGCAEEATDLVKLVLQEKGKLGVTAKL